MGKLQEIIERTLLPFAEKLSNNKYLKAISGGWRVALWQIFLIFVQMCVYYPFFRVLDNQALKEEREEVDSAAVNG